MAYEGRVALPLPELESVRILRESRSLREGGPGSGPHKGVSKHLGAEHGARIGAALAKVKSGKELSGKEARKVASTLQKLWDKGDNTNEGMGTSRDKGGSMMDMANNLADKLGVEIQH